MLICNFNGSRDVHIQLKLFPPLFNDFFLKIKEKFKINSFEIFYKLGEQHVQIFDQTSYLQCISDFSQKKFQWVFYTLNLNSSARPSMIRVHPAKKNKKEQEINEERKEEINKEIKEENIQEINEKFNEAKNEEKNEAKENEEENKEKNSISDEESNKKSAITDKNSRFIPDPYNLQCSLGIPESLLNKSHDYPHSEELSEIEESPIFQETEKVKSQLFSEGNQMKNLIEKAVWDVFEEKIPKITKEIIEALKKKKNIQQKKALDVSKIFFENSKKILIKLERIIFKKDSFEIIDR